MSEETFTAVVTGSSSGIGRDIVRRMLYRGWRVIGLSVDAHDFEHERFEPVKVDLLDEAPTKATAAAIAARHAVTHVVHNAGLIWPNMLDDVKPEEIDGLTRLQTRACRMTQRCFPDRCPVH